MGKREAALLAYLECKEIVLYVRTRHPRIYLSDSRVTGDSSLPLILMSRDQDLLYVVGPASLFSGSSRRTKKSQTAPPLPPFKLVLSQAT